MANYIRNSVGFNSTNSVFISITKRIFSKKELYAKHSLLHCAIVSSQDGGGAGDLENRFNLRRILIIWNNSCTHFVIAVKMFANDEIVFMFILSIAFIPSLAVLGRFGPGPECPLPFRCLVVLCWTNALHRPLDGNKWRYALACKWCEPLMRKLRSCIILCYFLFFVFCLRFHISVAACCLLVSLTPLPALFDLFVCYFLFLQ